MNNIGSVDQDDRGIAAIAQKIVAEADDANTNYLSNSIHNLVG